MDEANVDTSSQEMKRKKKKVKKKIIGSAETARSNMQRPSHSTAKYKHKSRVHTHAPCTRREGKGRRGTHCGQGGPEFEERESSRRQLWCCCCHTAAPRTCCRHECQFMQQQNKTSKQQTHRIHTHIHTTIHTYHTTATATHHRHTQTHTRPRALTS